MPAETTSIRGYRSRQFRPCDNCRSRRQRCIIPAPDQPCDLCTTTKKVCTFLRDRRKSAREVAKSRTESEALEFELPRSDDAGPGADGTAIVNLWSTLVDTGPSAPTQFSPIASPSTPQVATPASTLMSSILAGHSTAQMAVQIDDVHHVALDVEAAWDEELYLLGTASETDALMLNTMTDHLRSTDTTPGGSIPGVRVRRVMPNVSFIFYRSLPYGVETDETAAWAKLENLVGASLVGGVLKNFFDIEAMGHPIWPDVPHLLSAHLTFSSLALKSFCLTAGLIYTPSLRHLHREAYIMTMSHLRQQSPRARLWTMQVYLMDLDGREAINPSGNFVTLGMAVSVAKLLGLHEDCSAWTIPPWEKKLRRNLWWSLVIYDRFSSLIFGRPRSITQALTVPLPPRSSHHSHDAFVVKCELALLLDDLPVETPPDPSRLARLALIAARLDNWKESLDRRALCNTPGVRSLLLLSLGARLMLVRSIWDAIDKPDQEQARRGCLVVCNEVIDFLNALTPEDINGYWSSHSPFILSMCLTLLVRVIANSTDSATIRTESLVALQNYVAVLTRHQQNVNWDPANLAMSRAHYFIPLLARSNPDFGLVLTPAPNNTMPTDATLDEFMQTLVDVVGLEEFFGIQNNT